MSDAKMTDFFSRSAANDGITLPLTLPGGKKTEHWLKVRGSDSDEFRAANLEANRQAIRIARIEDPMARARELREQTLQLQAVLVKDWSFDKPCTVANVVDFLREAPYIADAVDRVATQRAVFIARNSNSSASTPDANSSSSNP